MLAQHYSIDFLLIPSLCLRVFRRTTEEEGAGGREGQ